MVSNQINPTEECQTDLKKLSDIRKQRAYSILEKGEPQLVNETTYLVPSSDGTKRYTVTHIDSYSCDCPDFQQHCKDKGIYCKHINAIILFQKFKNSLETEELNIEKELNKEACVYCGSENIVKDGVRKNKNGNKQKFLCQECKKRFVLEPIKYIKGNAKLVCLAMDCYYKGNSLRDIADTFKQFYGLKVTHETIRRWITRFTKLMDNYTKELKPEVSQRWHTDEQMVKAGNKWVWSWNTIDKDTRFWIANNVTKKKKIKDAREIFKQAKENVKEIPKDLELVTDGGLYYRKAIKKEFNTHKDFLGRTLKGNTTHLGNAGISKELNNNMVERLHNEFRDFDKVRRGFGNIETAQDNLTGMKLYHNFIKRNMALDGMIPYQKANIDLILGRNRWLSLLKLSLNQPSVTETENIKKSADY